MLEEILKKVDEFVKSEELKEIYESIKSEEIEMDYFSEDLLMGFKLVKKDDKLKLLVLRENLPGKDVCEYDWLGDEKDYKFMLDEIDYSGNLIPQIYIFLINQNKEIEKLKRIIDKQKETIDYLGH